MELGISPIVNAGMIMQLLSGAKIIDIDQKNEEERELYQGAQKLLAIVIGFVSAVLLITQLTLASVLVMLLDEMLSKGYGVGSAISLFIATNVCEDILWKSFSPQSINGEYEGAIIALLHGLVRKENKLYSIQQAFYGEFAPNINSIIATVFVFFIVNYFQGFQVHIAVHNKNIRGHTAPYSIKLFYTSNIPIILQGALISNSFFISRLLHKQFGGFFLVRLLGSICIGVLTITADFLGAIGSGTGILLACNIVF